MPSISLLTWRARPAPTGRSECWRVHVPSSPTATPPSRSIARRSSTSTGRGYGWNWPGPTCSTASGYVAGTGASTPARTRGLPTTCSGGSGHGRSPNGPDGSCRRRARRCASARSRPPTSSPCRRHKSPGSRQTAIPTRRSAPSCSSAPAPRSTTCTTCSPSSTSAPAVSSAGAWHSSSTPADPCPGRRCRPTGRSRDFHRCNHRGERAPRGATLHRDASRRESPMSKHTLERAAEELAEATSKPPFVYELGPDGARKVLDDLQAQPIAKPDVDETWITVPAEVGNVPVRIVKPLGATGLLPVVLYVHGGGWVLGNAGTHDRLVRELAVGTNAALVFVEYDRSQIGRAHV